ncbi:AIM24 family protein [Paenibacillus pinistramenti]|uniref:AIM24 family protein n=1 Tax=Paenibacillus pinistramenti TaxID=1768003 RepID=UPI001109E85E|nr:AIM24 family protein [Paenibacillus pinistramenti]
MDIRFETDTLQALGEAATFRIQEGETVHVLHPGQIIAYRGPSAGRADRLMDVKGMYRKRKLIRADLKGPSEFIAALPPGYSLKPLQLKAGSDLLYDYKHLFYYTDGVTMQSRILNVKNMLITRDAVKMKFSGQGQIGLLTEGHVVEAGLHPAEPLYVQASSVIAYPENARMELAVYGNHLASQHMSYHWKITGEGSVLLQAGRESSRKLEDNLQDESLFKRILREVIPFGGVFIK